MSAPRVVRPADPATTIRGAGDEYRYVATGAHTDGAYFLTESVVPPGAGPPPHIQTREEEMFSEMAKEPERFVEIGAEYGVSFPQAE